MKSLHRNDKRKRMDADGKSFYSAEDADRYIDQALRHDRALLSGKHDPERSKVRAMGVLAAGAVPAAEAGAGGGLASWISKTFGAKGIAGTVAVVAAAGGVTISTILLTKSPEPDAAPRPAAAVQAPAATSLPLPEEYEPTAIAPQGVATEAPASGNRVRTTEIPAPQSREGEVPADQVSPPAVNEPVEEKEPEVIHQSKGRSVLTFDRTITKKK